MTVDQLIARFPEIPRDLRDEPLLRRLVDALAPLLTQARAPSPCASGHDAANHYYLRLVGPLAIHGYGLSTREKTLEELEALLDSHAADPMAFAASLIPADAEPDAKRDPGCS